MTKYQVFTILQRAGGIRAARIITEHDENLGRWRVWRYARKLRSGVPVAKIIGEKWFYGLKFYTNKYTLDPRPDTETLVGAVIADQMTDVSPRILDLGTGTGCLICSLVKNIAGATGVATDLSWRALAVARRNIKKLGLTERVVLRRRSFHRPYDFGERFDIIVSNPPYIARGDVRVDDGATYDPDMALYAKNNGLAAYESIACNAAEWIKDDGKLYVEIGQGQGADVKNIFLHRGWNLVRSECDLGGIERVLVFARK